MWILIEPIDQNKITNFNQNRGQSYFPGTWKSGCMCTTCLEWCSGRQRQCIMFRISSPGTSVGTQFRVFLQALILPFANVQLNGKSSIKGCEYVFIYFWTNNWMPGSCNFEAALQFNKKCSVDQWAVLWPHVYVLVPYNEKYKESKGLITCGGSVPKKYMSHQRVKINDMSV